MTKKIDSKKLLELFHANGITTLEDFSKVAAPSLDDEQIEQIYRSVQNESVPVTEEMIKKIKSHTLTKSERFRLNVPFEVGTTLYDPKDLKLFDGNFLALYIDDSLLKKNQLKGFKSDADLKIFLTEIDDSSQKSLKHNVPGEPAFFYEHANYGGKQLRLDYRHAFPNLKNVTYSGFWFFRKDWNDRISSIKTTHWRVSCYVDADFSGRYLIVERNTNLPYVGNFWNDKTSSIIETLF